MSTAGSTPSPRRRPRCTRGLGRRWHPTSAPTAARSIFVRNATEALNLVAYSWGRTNLAAGDRIVVTEMEHHSNVVPWYQVAQEKGAHLDWAPITDDGRLDMDAFAALLERGPKLVCVAHVSNVLGTINPIEEIARLAHDAGALLVVDGAQAGPKLELDMGELGADFYAVTAHKMYGPTGIGALFGRRELLEEMPPFIGGGSMIRKVTKELITWADLPAKFEGGTPPIGEAVGFGAAVRWIDELGLPGDPRRRGRAHRLRPRARRGGPRPDGLRPPAGTSAVASSPSTWRACTRTTSPRSSTGTASRSGPATIAPRC